MNSDAICKRTRCFQLWSDMQIRLASGSTLLVGGDVGGPAHLDSASERRQ